MPKKNLRQTFHLKIAYLCHAKNSMYCKYKFKHVLYLHWEMMHLQGAIAFL